MTRNAQISDQHPSMDDVQDAVSLDLQQIFLALSSPIRLDILEALRESAEDGKFLQITEVADLVSVSRFAARHHLAILRGAGLVIGEKSHGRHLHRLNLAAFTLIESWLYRILPW